MKEKELARLSDCFDRLELLSNEVSCLVVKLNTEELSRSELPKGVVWCQLAGELRDVVLRYRPDLEELEDAGPFARCVNWACAAMGGGACNEQS